MYERWGKRALDVAGAALILLLAAPLLLAAMLMVRLALGTHTNQRLAPDIGPIARSYS